MKVPIAYWIEVAAPNPAVAVARTLRAAGVERLDAYTPFGVPELEAALDLPRPRLLPTLVLGAGLSGLAVAFVVLWWTAAVDYLLDVGGRPLVSLPTYIPIMFETGILFAAGAAFFACLFLSGLPTLTQPVTVAGFERTSSDRFWVGVDARDPAFRRELLQASFDAAAREDDEGRSQIAIHVVEAEVAD